MTGTVVSPFSAESLRAAVENYFADVPADHVCAQIEYRMTDGTIRFEMAARVKGHWEVQGALAWNLKTGRVQEGSVRVVGSWVRT
jgi:hypothetical protein